MGLDQYAYATDSNDEQVEIAYWRKHNRLQGWMEQLWENKGRPNFNGVEDQAMGNFNCVPLELTEDDLDALETDVCEKAMPETGGFFFGDDSFGWTTEDGEQYQGKDYHYKLDDLEFLEKARQAISQGQKVYYNSWY
ncbi:MAG: phosphoglycerate kinase [Paracoccaceae bacterium]